MRVAGCHPGCASVSTLGLTDDRARPERWDVILLNVRQHRGNSGSTVEKTLLDRRRELAFLAASGMLDSELEHAARREITMVALPLAVAGSALGAVPIGLSGGASPMNLRTE